MAVTDILISPAKIWKSPVGEALPDETSVAYGASWGGNWENVGYTLEPLSMSYDRELFELMVEQITGPVKRRVTGENLRMETVLAEATPDNLQLAIGGTVSSTSAGASQVAFEDLDAGGEVQLDELQWGFEGFYENASGVQFPVRIFLYKATAILNGQLTFAKAAAAGVPIQISAMADTSKSVGANLIKFQRVTAAATS
ncbi:MAG: hypothetical protein R2932_59310 [Caldilineaceae bacterium]